MVRISAIFIAFCLILIAAAVGAVLHFRFGYHLYDAALAALAILSVLALYKAVAGRRQDRAEVSDQVAGLARGASDLARQLAEFGRRLDAVESEVEKALDRAAAAPPVTGEIEELSRLVKQLSETVALHDAALVQYRDGHKATATVAAAPLVAQSETTSVPGKETAAPAARSLNKIAAFRGLDRDAIIAVLHSAMEANKIELYLQPIVTLPQRKVRYYEALSRLNAETGEVIAAGDFLPYVEAGALLPKLDNLAVQRCVQLVRRLLLKNREIGLFCNLSLATLAFTGFPQLLEFLDANRAIASSLAFEFSQSAVRAMGPIEHESLAALAERGFRFSMDNLSDLGVDPRDLNDRGFRFIKAPAALLLGRGSRTSNIHPADFSDLLGRFGIDLIAERIESETTVVDLLDYDVRFAQGFLFSPPRPVRADALQGGGDAGKTGFAKTETAGAAPALPR